MKVIIKEIQCSSLLLTLLLVLPINGNGKASRQHSIVTTTMLLYMVEFRKIAMEGLDHISTKDLNLRSEICNIDIIDSDEKDICIIHLVETLT